MDDTDPDIVFDNSGICNHCHEYESRINVKPARLKIEKKESDYDCVIGLSGGVDSSYVAYYVVKELKLKPLAVHVDNGWNSIQATKNVKSICETLDIDLETVVLNWAEFRRIQKAFILSKSADVDVPTDHAIFYCVYKFCVAYKVPLINGINRKYESHHPLSWSQGHLDGRYIRQVYRNIYHRDLVNFKTAGFGFLWKWNSTKTINLLDYIEYDRDKALEIIKSLGWVEYGGKHEESTFTKWFQQIYLPDMLGIDKRKMHYSSLICAGEISREDALKIIKKPPVEGLKKELLTEYVLDKLDLDIEDYNGIHKIERSHYFDYPSYYGLLIELKKKLTR